MVSIVIPIMLVTRITVKPLLRELSVEALERRVIHLTLVKPCDVRWSVIPTK
jgi:hypothetical protein